MEIEKELENLKSRVEKLEKNEKRKQIKTKVSLIITITSFIVIAFIVYFYIQNLSQIISQI